MKGVHYTYGDSANTFVGTTSLIVILRGNIIFSEKLCWKVRLRRTKKKNSHTVLLRAGWDELRSIMINLCWFRDIEILDGSKISLTFLQIPVGTATCKLCYNSPLNFPETLFLNAAGPHASAVSIWTHSSQWSPRYIDSKICCSDWPDCEKWTDFFKHLDWISYLRSCTARWAGF